MKKIPTMFVRDETQRGHPITDKIKPECEWVLQWEGFPTRKIDGTNVKILNGGLLKRQKPKTGEYDEASYIPVDFSDPSDAWIVEAFNNLETKSDGIYEAIGPKIQGNPERLAEHKLIAVDPVSPYLYIQDLPGRTFDILREYLSKHDIEGIVFHDFHDINRRMAKIKKRDFGLKRESPAAPGAEK